MHRRPPKNHLRNMFRPYKIRDGIRHAPPFQPHHFRAQILREFQIRRQRVYVRFLRPKLPIHMHHIQLRVHPPRQLQALLCAIKYLSCRIRRNAHRHPLPYAPILADVLIFHVRLEAAIHLLCNLPQKPVRAAHSNSHAGKNSSAIAPPSRSNTHPRASSGSAALPASNPSASSVFLTPPAAPSPAPSRARQFP